MIQRTKGHMWLCITLLIINLIFIWGNSLLPGEISGAISHWVKDILSQIIPGKPSSNQGHGLLRKMAHFTEFGCLGLFLSWLIRMVRERKWEYWLLPLFAGFLVACIDETIQMFIPDRGPGIRDVAIDTAGVFVGIALFSLVYFMKKRGRLSAEG